MVLSARGRLALLLGGGFYLGAWAFGAQALYPVAVGLPLAVLAAAAVVRLAARPMGYRRRFGSGDHLEGDDVTVDVEVEPRGPFGLASVVVLERLGKLGGRRIQLRRAGRVLRARYRLERLPRGRYPLEAAVAVVEDPFGLERATVELPAEGALLVLPRVVELEAVFSETGVRAIGGRRLLLRRPTGFDVHSVREYEQGESLRKVHWPSTARRGDLMVKELEDEPRDEVAIVLDAPADGAGGAAFDAQVRVAGSLLHAQARRERRAVLVVNTRPQQILRVQSYAGDWRRALELLAAVEPTGDIRLGALLADDSGPAARSFELALVTSRLDPLLVERILQRASARRLVSVVFVDAPTFSGRPPSREPGLLRLGAAGIPVAVVRRGDDLAKVLSASDEPQVAHG